EEARAQDVRDLVRVFRLGAGLSGRLDMVRQRLLPPLPEGLEGTNCFVLASDRIAHDSAGQLALRQWLQRGGALWVLLDWVQPEPVAALLGDALDFEVVDRATLTGVELRSGPANPQRAGAPARELEEPVDLVRVLAPGPRTLFTVNGWPAA